MTLSTNNKAYNYVLSGLKFTRISLPLFVSLKKNVEVVNDYLSKLEDYQISFLFNAFTEPESGKILHDNYPGTMMFADSGGLQIITRGDVLTPELKNEMYNVQGQFADVGMCFDEIPLAIDTSGQMNNKQNRVSIDNKVFKRSWIKEKAIQTGQNINNQIIAFEKMGSSCKPMIIAQGNDPQSFADFVNYIYETLEPGFDQKIHGIALADTCIGNGILETFDMVRSLRLMNVPSFLKKNLHFLGVGSLKRLLPVIEAKRAGVFEDGVQISFDSTSHSSCLIMGRMVNEKGQMRSGKIREINKENEPMFLKVYDTMYKKYYDDVPDFYPLMNEILDNIHHTRHLKVESEWQLYHNIFFFFFNFLSVHHFMKTVVECDKDFNNYRKYIRNIDFNIYELIGKSNRNDFDKIVDDYKLMIPSKRILNESVNKVSLESFFA